MDVQENEYNLNKCRTCLVQRENMKSIIENSDEIKALITKIYSIINEEIPLDPMYPAYICNICEEKVIAFYEFQQQCKVANAIACMSYTNMTDKEIKIESNPLDYGEFVQSDTKNESETSFKQETEIVEFSDDNNTELDSKKLNIGNVALGPHNSNFTQSEIIENLETIFQEDNKLQMDSFLHEASESSTIISNSVIDSYEERYSDMEDSVLKVTETVSNFVPEQSQTNEDYLPIVHSEINQRYIRMSSARERPTICPLCHENVISHFPRHLFRHHKNNSQVKQIKSLKPGSKERLAMMAALRKRGYFHMKVEKNILVPTRTSKNPNTDYFVCSYCLGHYTKQLLFKHVKRCKNKPDNIIDPGKNCLGTSQTFLASATSKNQEFLKTSRINNEVFKIMRADDTSMLAKTDPLICLYGEYLLVKHEKQQIAVVISNKIREMARMLKVIRRTTNDIFGFFDLLKPEMFEKLIFAAKVISGYNADENTFKAPSLALHMGTNLKQICDVALKIVLENRNIPNIRWDDKTKKISEIKDLKKLIYWQWCNELSSLALKSLQEGKLKKSAELPVPNDILVFQRYLNDLAEEAYNAIIANIDIDKNYKILAQCVLSLTVMFNRKGVGDVQYLTIETYNNYHNNGEQAFSESLTAVEKIMCKQFKTVVTGGKGSKPKSIFFAKRIQEYVACLLKIRETTDVVPKTNPYLFANPASKDRWIDGANIIRRHAKSSGAQKPDLLISTRCRKHIATTLQLTTMQPEEMEQIATFMGHTQKTHAEFYRLPQDIYQAAKVAKVLLLLEKGKGRKFKGKSLNDIELRKDFYYSSDSEVADNEQSLEAFSEENVHPTIDLHSTNNELDLKNNYSDRIKEIEQKITPDANMLSSKNKIKMSCRIRWSDQEKKIVLDYFKEHVQQKITPKKGECDEFLKIYGKQMLKKDWVRIKAFVYNFFRNK